MGSEALKRAKSVASVLTDPTTKKTSFYCIIRREAKKYAQNEGVVDFEIRKSLLFLWVQEYLESCYLQELPLKEEKALTNTSSIVNFIMKNKVPDHVTKCLTLKKEHEGSGTYVRHFKEVFGGKAPRRSPKY